MGNTFLKSLIGFKADNAFAILTFQKFTKVRRSECRVTTKIKPDLPFLVAVHHRLLNGAPTFDAMNVARVERTPLQIIELVEQEKRMIAGATRSGHYTPFPLVRHGSD
jgi:hypothetical protein